MKEEVKLSPRVRAILEAADCSTGYEIPRDVWEAFPGREYLSEIKVIQKRIESELGLSLRRDGFVQDASFYDELFIYRSDAFPGDGSITHLVQIGIRFSNFGKLYTIYASEMSNKKKFDTEGIERIINSFGWTYISAEEPLEATYDGKHDRLRGRISWWERFFDYTEPPSFYGVKYDDK